MAISAPAAAIISAGMQSGMSISGNIMSYRSNRLNREWNERQANTAHQREVKDLRAAGINPILTADGGGGAMTPVMQPWEPDLSGIGQAASNAVDNYYRLGEDKIKQFEANQASKNGAAHRATEASIQDVNSAVAAKTEAETLKTLSEIPNIDKIGALLAAQEAAARASANASSAQAQKTNAEKGIIDSKKAEADAEAAIYGSKAGKLIKAIEIIAPAANSATGAVRNLIPGKGVHINKTTNNNWSPY